MIETPIRHPERNRGTSSPRRVSPLDSTPRHSPTIGTSAQGHNPSASVMPPATSIVPVQTRSRLNHARRKIPCKWSRYASRSSKAMIVPRRGNPERGLFLSCQTDPRARPPALTLACHPDEGRIFSPRRVPPEKRISWTVRTNLPAALTSRFLFGLNQRTSPRETPAI